MDKRIGGRFELMKCIAAGYVLGDREKRPLVRSVWRYYFFRSTKAIKFRYFPPPASIVLRQ